MAAKLGLPIAHVEAGLRSFDDTMPEEVNRRVTDLLSDLLFVTSPEGVDNLARTGVPPGSDPPRRQPDDRHAAGEPRPVRRRAGCGLALALPERYAVATMHRPANVDDPDHGGPDRGDAARASPSWCRWSSRSTRAAGRRSRRPVWPTIERLRIVDPLGYVDFLSLVRGAALVVTDSGGIQEETTVLGVPCLTVRPNTERPITITHGTNRLLEPDAVVAAAVRSDPGRRPGRPGRGPAAVGRARRRADRRDRGGAGWRAAAVG